MTGHLDIRHSDGKTYIGIKAVPGSSRTSITGVWNGMLKVKVSSPPEKGKANDALTVFLAQTLGVKSGDIAIIRGTSNPVKHIEIRGIFDENAFICTGRK